ncbi:peptide chain release factor N(5)-glutamine methyltransferase [Pediococcus ethanolidurans]|uniref:peptide chain release factor N(5)-glutamine methyltransferase n=1 Tax=Pediococcus ethanolidurans TaxID=319653 RepID=UPI001C1EB74A|nr:peptide chain release factor N(5)-glutamine methyltransferase [Pediococcus ethanolidurans]MBU7555264.1 peptide chain release factor N(5)-glutamine methyltransferase [Pediococcus ethanolidurans]MBU7562615.1 peptide chain release factor N(5)-glutamine methyltransferase [Pediococcus ethanolidurans]MCT4398990.1 peptide chain release factor N(5)-glutamine methyltransferase [Pediococcus ethanolidurans]MCV3315679.1 peptide chain release factor N(5)-glutamine methyltransferase [Pediococcus ethanolid
MNDPTYLEALKWAFLYLKPIDQEGIDESGAKLLLANMMNWNNTQLILHYRDSMKLSDWLAYQKNIHQYAKGVPAQYVTNQATFYGNNLFVDERVLIPRFETEELVEWVLKDNDETPCTVLDIGTGSGAIAIALKKQRPNWQITGSDISKAALQVAQKNVNLQKIEVALIQSDLFENLGNQKFDIIVSNPPYIAESEKTVMDQSVIQYEPNQALFAKEQGLAIYRQISQQVKEHLTVHGRLYCEFGYHQKQALENLFQDTSSNYQVEFKKDVTNHDRMMRVTLNNERKV